MGFLLWALAANASASGPSDPGWPRTFTDEKSELVVYQPQLNARPEYKALSGRCAFTAARLDQSSIIWQFYSQTSVHYQ